MALRAWGLDPALPQAEPQKNLPIEFTKSELLPPGRAQRECRHRLFANRACDANSLFLLFRLQRLCASIAEVCEKGGAQRVLARLTS